MDSNGSEAGEGGKQETVEVEETVGIVVAVTDEEGQGEGNSKREESPMKPTHAQWWTARSQQLREMIPLMRRLNQLL